MKANTKFGDFGGIFVPEALVPALEELEDFYFKLKNSNEFFDELYNYLSDYAGRPTPLYYAANFSKRVNAKIYLKREDLLHGGAHKTNNAVGQALLAKKMGKTRIIAETGAGQHGIATAMAGALLRMETEIFMGVEDIERQKINVKRMRLCGARVNPVEISEGTGTLKDAVSEALRDYTSNVRTTHYLIGSVVGPHPYPTLVRDLQGIIGTETRKQILEKEDKLPKYVLACVGGGSNALGIFTGFFEDKDVNLIGIEAAGKGINTSKHCASVTKGTKGCFQGSCSYVLQDKHGQIKEPYSISAGLDYPGVGPQHAELKSKEKAKYYSVTDKEAMEGFRTLSEDEGIIPALESSHVLGYLLKSDIGKNETIIVNLSGRGDKDLEIVDNYEGDDV